MKKILAFVVIFLIFSVFVQCEKGRDSAGKTKDLHSTKNATENGREKPEYIIFLTYGSVPPVGYVYEGMDITKKFGFEIKNPSGCDMTDSLFTAIKHNNLKSADLMKKKYGKNWIQDFEKRTGLQFSVPYVPEE